MRIVMLGSENDLGDIAEQWTGVTGAMWLTQAEQLTLEENVVIYREAVKTGEAFGQLIEELVTRHNADFLMVDPLLGFAGGDVSKQEFCSHFLRHILQPVLMRTGCCLIAAHHQNKPPKKKEDNMQSTYDFTGSAELANWFRSTAILRREHQEHPHFILKLGKRGNRSGMRDERGQFTESLRIRHSKTRGQIKWEVNDQPPLEEDDV
jgi:RecA-family ATPase